MLKNNIYNIDEEFDYSPIIGIVAQYLRRIIKEEGLERSNIITDTIFDSGRTDDHDNVKLSASPIPLSS
jgi:hypothetical protein